MKQDRLKRRSYAILTGPALLVYLGIIIFPILYSFSLSFTAWGGFGTPQFIGLGNYTKMFQDDVFLHGLRNNILVVIISVFGQLPLGFVLAYILYRKLVKAASFFETMIFLPITISAIVVALLWNQILGPSGIFSVFLRSMNNDPSYTFLGSIVNDKQLAMLPVLFVILWMYTGMYMVMFLANLQKISPSVIEAAVIDGATEGQILLRIILPQMLNILYTTAIFAITGSLKSFDLIWAMTGGGPANYTTVIAIYMYLNTFKYYNYGFGSAVSVAIVILSVGLITVLQRFMKRFEDKYEA